MTEAQIHKFIFAPGFSTAAAVTSVSGRGVGMDVVRTNIDQIGGTIDVKSVAGEGSSVTIKIPLTLAIVSALIVEAAGDRFAIPAAGGGRTGARARQFRAPHRAHQGHRGACGCATSCCR
jgi:chemotaxis protein histidine kinase CheA